MIPFDIDDGFTKMISQMGFDLLSTIMRKREDEKTPIEKRILTAVLLSGSYHLGTEQHDHFLKLIIALETLYLDDYEAKSENVAERLAFSISDEMSDRKEIYHLMKQLYGIRYNIVHRGLV